MTRTHKSTGHWEHDEDYGTYFQRPCCCSKKHSTNMSKWAFRYDIWPEDGQDGLRIPRRNRTSQAFYEMCHHMCTEWEVNKMSEKLDGQAMDKEWKRMQDEAEQETE